VYSHELELTVALYFESQSASAGSDLGLYIDMGGFYLFGVVLVCGQEGKVEEVAAEETRRVLGEAFETWCLAREAGRRRIIQYSGTECLTTFANLFTFTEVSLNIPYVFSLSARTQLLYQSSFTAGGLCGYKCILLLLGCNG